MAEYEVTVSKPHSAEPGTGGKWHRVFLEVERENFEAKFGVHNWVQVEGGERYPDEIQVTDRRWGEGPDEYVIRPAHNLIIACGMTIYIPEDVMDEFIETIEDKALPEGGDTQWR